MTCISFGNGQPWNYDGNNLVRTPLRALQRLSGISVTRKSSISVTCCEMSLDRILNAAELRPEQFHLPSSQPFVIQFYSSSMYSSFVVVTSRMRPFCASSDIAVGKGNGYEGTTPLHALLFCGDIGALVRYGQGSPLGSPVDGRLEPEERESYNRGSKSQK
ncbi:unnamed protein product [Rangifer tarandus platyrhynchus]|uniref:Uncharacterized protein n=1 Tax=Rangifer tarandus platyrhynchus TaxID=3082113 RepID=A0ABN8XII2_RANTA|nr:unnamed protein product [Rangifer tarandus platyrhynchus]